jgi:hypothetical protein
LLILLKFLITKIIVIIVKHSNTNIGIKHNLYTSITQNIYIINLINRKAQLYLSISILKQLNLSLKSQKILNPTRQSLRTQFEVCVKSTHLFFVTNFIP